MCCIHFRGLVTSINPRASAPSFPASLLVSGSAKLPLDAKAWKMSHAGQLLPTTVVSEERHSEDITIDGNALKVVKDGKAETINKSVEKAGENWSSISFGDTKITRTIM